MITITAADLRDKELLTRKAQALAENARTLQQAANRLNREAAVIMEALRIAGLISTDKPQATSSKMPKETASA